MATPVYYPQITQITQIKNINTDIVDLLIYLINHSTGKLFNKI